MRCPYATSLVIALIMSVAGAAHADPPVPGEPTSKRAGPTTEPSKAAVQPPMSPCSQSHDDDDDGALEGITYYVYDQRGALTDTVVFDPVDVGALAWQHLTVDDRGQPLKAVLRQPPDAKPVKAPTDCTTQWCSRAWVGLCSIGTCTRDDLNRVVTMRLDGGGLIRNDYGCWSTTDDAARYVGPSLDTLLSATSAPDQGRVP